MTDDFDPKNPFANAKRTPKGNLKERHPIWMKIQENGEHPDDIRKTLETFTDAERYDALLYYVEWIAIYQGYEHDDDAGS